METNGHFEKLEHQMPDGTLAVIPVYVGEDAKPLLESEDLLKIAVIIGSTLSKEGFLALEDLVAGVEEIIVNPDQEGILIEDEERGESVVITTEETTLLLRGIGRKAIPTSLLSDMLHVWSQEE